MRLASFTYYYQVFNLAKKIDGAKLSSKTVQKGSGFSNAMGELCDATCESDPLRTYFSPFALRAMRLLAG